MMNATEIRKRIRSRLAEQRVLVATLLRLREQLRGSLFVRYGQCGKEACACRTGEKHGPYYVLSGTSRRSRGFSYLEGERLREARQLVARYRAFRRGLRRLRRINVELVALLHRYQESMTRQGSRRLQLTAAGSS